MGNCLVTKLKENVQNDSLKKLGVIAFTSKNGFFIQFNDTIEISIDGVKTTHTAGQYVYNNTNDHQVEISNKYALTFLQFYANNVMDLSELNYLTSVTAIDFSTQSASGITGTLGSIENCHTIESITIGGNNKIQGTIDDLAKNTPNLNNLLLDCEFASGRVEDFVLAFVKSGRTTSSANVYFGSNGRIYYHNADVVQTGYTKEEISWSPNSGDNTKTDITFKGVTETIDANGNIVS